VKMNMTSIPIGGEPGSKILAVKVVHVKIAQGGFPLGGPSACIYTQDQRVYIVA
jgi:hypothetical protein